MGSTTITKYYQAGGQRIALRVNGVVRWLATDHLGSTALTASETGGRLSEIRYKPWGESRYSFGATPTKRRFTGQRWDSGTALYFYQSRWYDPYTPKPLVLFGEVYRLAMPSLQPGRWQPTLALHGPNMNLSSKAQPTGEHHWLMTPIQAIITQDFFTWGISLGQLLVTPAIGFEMALSAS